MKTKKKMKLKKGAYFLLLGIVVVIVGVILGINYYNDFKYKETMEYQLMEKGYSKEDTEIILNKLTEEQAKEVLDKDFDETIALFIKEKYYLHKNLDEYLRYYYEDDDEESELKEIVAIVNVHANLKWYEETYETDISLKEEMIVNKFYALDSDYTPENTKTISLDQAYGKEGENILIDYAYEKFIDLWNAAKEDGFHLMVNSSYRDYESQKEIYDYRKSTQGERKADETTAHPGHSEHQTGLVVDMTSTNAKSDEDFSESDAYKWLKENAYKFGFIERYPEGKTYLTGYSPESWHWRYVGEKAAKICHDENITYDEYYAFYIEK